ncbi:MAG: hypothetical protein ABDI20_00110, partial [Candidatus Bipolaricaulaceae bacterium]
MGVKEMRKFYLILSILVVVSNILAAEPIGISLDTVGQPGREMFTKSVPSSDRGLPSLVLSELVIDPESLWLLPHALGAGVLERKGTRRYTVIAGGRKPSAWNDLRGFGWLAEYYPFEPARPEPLSHARAEPLAGMSLTVFLWELADHPGDNVLLKFKTEAELTIEAYNLALQYGLPANLGIANDSKGTRVAVVGEGKTTLAKVKRLSELDIEGLIRVTGEYIYVPAQGAIYILEDLLGIKLEELAFVLYQLAKAEEEGRFAQAFEELRPKGLAALERLLEELAPPRTERERIEYYIRQLARHVKKLIKYDSSLQQFNDRANLPNFQFITVVEDKLKVTPTIFAQGMLQAADKWLRSRGFPALEIKGRFPLLGYDSWWWKGTASEWYIAAIRKCPAGFAIYLMIYALGEYAKKYMFLKDRVDFAAEFLPSVLLAAAQIDEVDVRT